MPYDLFAPARMLTSRFSPYGMNRPVTSMVKIGAEGEEACIKRFQFPDGNITYQVYVACDAAPHCQYCECDSNHYVKLTEEQVTALRKLLEK